LGSKKNDTIKQLKHNDQDGFILPMVMILLMLFTFYTMNAIEHIDNERDFLKERQVAVMVDLQKKISVYDLVDLLSKGVPVNKSGRLDYPECYVTYEITEPQTGTEMVNATLYMGDHRDSFIFFYDENTQAIAKWVD
jgi:hypothetical protein